MKTQEEIKKILESRILIHKGKKVKVSEIIQQRTFGFNNEPELVSAQVPLSMEEIEDTIIDNIKNIEGWFALYESGTSWEFEDLYYYKDIPSIEEFAKAIGYDYDDINEFADKVLKSQHPEVYTLWKEKEDDVYNMGNFFEEYADQIGWIFHGAGNTYNWNYLGPRDLNFHIVESPNDTIYTFYSIHLGGDIRGGYSSEYIFVDTYESGFYEAISGSATVIITFKDDSKWILDSTQDSDVWYFEFQRDMSLKEGTLASRYYPYIENLSGMELEDKLGELWDDWKH